MNRQINPDKQTICKQTTDHMHTHTHTHLEQQKACPLRLFKTISEYVTLKTKPAMFIKCLQMHQNSHLYNELQRPHKM